MNQLALNSPSFAKRRRIRQTAASARRGLTLIELIIAVTLTLVIVGIMVRAFKSASDEISIGRARMDMQNQLRMVTETLRRDLQNATCTPRPRGIADERTGYFEYVEGDEVDKDHTLLAINSFVGDHDDILALTVRSVDRPFRGRWVNDNGTVVTTDDTIENVESYLAEIVWWIVHDDTNMDGEVQYTESTRLYRRVLLIRPDLAAANIYGPADFADFYATNDISVRTSVASLISNNLEELAVRANRFAHNTTIFPNEFDRIRLDSAPYAGNLEGEDLVLSDCAAFDIKVFDPTVQVFIPDDIELPPGANPGLRIDQTIEFNDPAMQTFLTNYPPETLPVPMFPNSYPYVGGYVDLGYDTDALTAFDDPIALQRWFNNESVDRPTGYTFSDFPKTWCTWWAGYEFDGVDQDNVNGVDQGSNGVDDDLINGVDDNDERETPPPYAKPLRSVQISIRLIEKKTNQVLQKTIKESFVPN